MNGIEERVDDIIAKDGGISLKSFEIQHDLNRDFWNRRSDNRLFPEIRIALLNIAQDFLKSLSLDEVLDKNKFVDPNNLVKDVLFLGSLASYNYSSYSDVDLHLLVDLSLLKLTPDQEALVKSYFNLKKNDWNAKHSHLLVKGHDVELYVQDINEKNAANGIYSLVQDRWLKPPVRMPDHSFSEKQVKSKAMWYITRIDHLAEMLDRENLHSWDVQKIHDICQQIKDKVVKTRRASLNGVSKAERNEMCEPNLVFKVLRRTGHIGKLNDLIDRSYDLAKSLVEEELTVGLGVVEDCCCVAALGGDGFGDGKPALTKGDYHLPEVLTKNPLRRKNTMNESTKITLTVGQLRRLVLESESTEDDYYSYEIENGVLVGCSPKRGPGGYKHDVVVPVGVREIGSNAFLHSSATTITIPASVKTIAKDALTSVRLSRDSFSNVTYDSLYDLKRIYVANASQKAKIEKFDIPKRAKIVVKDDSYSEEDDFSLVYSISVECEHEGDVDRECRDLTEGDHAEIVNIDYGELGHDHDEYVKISFRILDKDWFEDEFGIDLSKDDGFRAGVLKFYK